LSSAQPKTSQAAAGWRPISQGFDERERPLRGSPTTSASSGTSRLIESRE
jgi:hypothetical protein